MACHLCFLRWRLPTKVGFNVLWMSDIYVKTLIRHWTLAITSNTFKCLNFIFKVIWSGYIGRLGETWHMLCLYPYDYITSLKTKPSSFGGLQYFSTGLWIEPCLFPCFRELMSLWLCGVYGFISLRLQHWNYQSLKLRSINFLHLTY